MLSMPELKTGEEAGTKKKKIRSEPDQADLQGKCAWVNGHKNEVSRAQQTVRIFLVKC